MGMESNQWTDGCINLMALAHLEVRFILAPRDDLCHYELVLSYCTAVSLRSSDARKHSAGHNTTEHNTHVRKFVPSTQPDNNANSC